MAEEDYDWFQGVVEILWKLVPLAVVAVVFEVAYLIASKICVTFWWGINYTVGCFK